MTTRSLTSTLRMRRATPYIFISPFFIAFAVFGAFPILYAFFLSFQRWNGIKAMKFNGIENYTFILTDFLFWKAFANTIVMFIITQIPLHVMALVFAFLLSRGYVRLRNAFKATFFLPYLTSSVAVALIFTVFYGNQFGLFNRSLKYLMEVPFIGALFSYIEYPVYWLEGYWLPKISVSMLTLWKWTGWNTILYLAGLQSINENLYEAAKIDGANERSIFFHITLPHLRPMMFFTFSMSLIFGLQMFDEPYVLFPMYEGGPDNTAMTSTLYIYRTAFYHGYYGTAAAAAYLLFLIIVSATLVFARCFKDES